MTYAYVSSLGSPGDGELAAGLLSGSTEAAGTYRRAPSPDSSPARHRRPANRKSAMPLERAPRYLRVAYAQAPRSGSQTLGGVLYVKLCVETIATAATGEQVGKGHGSRICLFTVRKA